MPDFSMPKSWILKFKPGNLVPSSILSDVRPMATFKGFMADEQDKQKDVVTGQDSATLVYQQYAHKVIGLAEAQLSRKLSARVDGEDVAQSVFRTFFRRQELGEFNIENSIELWALLAKITIAKAKSQARKHTAAKRNVAIEFGGESAHLNEVRSWNPGPADAAIFLDLLANALESLSDMHGQILFLRIEGWSKVDIARELNISRQSVDRVLKLLQERLERLGD